MDHETGLDLQTLCNVADAFNTTNEGYAYVCDMDEDFYHIVPKALDRFPFPSTSFHNVTETHRPLVHPDDFERLSAELAMLYSGEVDTHELTYRWLDRTGKPVWVCCRGRVLHEQGKRLFIGSVTEVSTTQMADRHTGLLHGNVLLNRLKGDCNEDITGFITYLSINNLQQHASDMGMEALSSLLHDVAQCIVSSLGSGQDAFSFDGGGFLVLDNAHPNLIEAERLYQRICSRISHLAHSRSLKNVTVAACTIDAETVNANDRNGLDARFRFAIAQARKSGGFSHTLFDNEAYQENLKIEQQIIRIKDALENEEFFCVYQPKVRMSTGAVIGAEALVRWNDPQRGIVCPDEFIDLMEQNSMIPHLDRYVWEQVCRTMQGWMAAGTPTLPISVNVSRVDISSLNVADELVRLTSMYGIPAHLIEVEITETTYATDNEHVAQVVRDLQKEGFRVLIDDFGSGYSSLTVLKDLDVDILKTDIKFLQLDEANRSRGTEIIKTIVDMARQLNLGLLAEGVETQEQANLLSLLGCQYAQGFLYYHPLAADEYAKLLSVPGKVETFSAMTARAKGSYLQEIGEYFWMALDVNLETGEYRVIKRPDNPHWIPDPLPQHITDLGRWYLENLVHPDDAEGLFEFGVIDNIKRRFDEGASRLSYPERLFLDGDWRFVTCEVTKPKRYSHPAPWVLYTWRYAEDESALELDLRDVTELMFHMVARIDFRTMSITPIKHFDNVEDNLGNGQPIFDWIEASLQHHVHPDDHDVIRQFTEECRDFRVHKQGMKRCAYRRITDSGYQWSICEVSRSREYTDEHPVLMMFLRDLEYALELSTEQQPFSSFLELLKSHGEKVAMAKLRVQDHLAGSFRDSSLVNEGLRTAAEEMGTSNAFIIRFVNGHVRDTFFWPPVPANIAQQSVDVLNELYPILKQSIAPNGVFVKSLATLAGTEALQDRGFDRLVEYPFFNEEGELICLYGTFAESTVDIDEKMLSEIAKVFMAVFEVNDAYQAAHMLGNLDLLTGLKNRNAFEMLMDRQRNKFVRKIACAYLDANGLHELNNSQGHEAGDKMLKAIAREIVYRFGDEGCYRIGGDEFLVLQPCEDEEAFCQQVAEAAHTIEGQGYSVAAGCHWSYGPIRFNELLTKAELCMFADKRRYYERFGDRRH